MQIVPIGDAPTRAPDWQRTLMVKNGAVWLWPGIPLTRWRGRTVVPVDADTARWYLTKWHGPEANAKPLAMMLACAAEHLSDGDATAAQAVLDRAGFTHVSPEGASLMEAVAARLATPAPGMPVLARNPLWQTRDVALLVPMFDGFAETATHLEKADVSDWDPAKHPRLGAAPNPGWFADTEGDDSESAAEPPPEGVPADRLPALEDEYDGLGPVEFAKAVIQFGLGLSRRGNQLSAAEREDALVRYAFLQDRLSFWLGYDYKPPRAQDNLLSAAVVVYHGAVDGGLVRVGGAHGGLPASMLAVAGAAAAYDNGPPSGKLRLPSEPGPEDDFHEPYAIPEPSAEPDGSDAKPQPASRFGPGEPPVASERLGELGGIIDNKDVGIVWDGGIEAQGLPFEKFVGEQKENLTELSPGATGFDHFDQMSGEAVSAKTLNTLSVTYIKRPNQIFGRLKRYTDDIVNYKPWRTTDLSPGKIVSKTIHLGVPEYTSAIQWQQIARARSYTESRGISFIVTRIR